MQPVSIEVRMRIGGQPACHLVGTGRLADWLLSGCCLAGMFSMLETHGYCIQVHGAGKASGTEAPRNPILFCPICCPEVLACGGYVYPSSSGH